MALEEVGSGGGGGATAHHHFLEQKVLSTLNLKARNFRKIFTCE